MKINGDKMKKCFLSLGLQSGSKFAKSVVIRAHKTFNNMLARVNKYIQCKKKLAANKITYEGRHEK